MVKKPKSNRETFSAPVHGWITKSDAAMLAIFQQSSQDVIELMQKPKAKGGNMPVRTGFLRSSLQVTLNTPYMGFIPRESGRYYEYQNSTVVLTINNAKLGDIIYAAYAANYAVHREYGTQHSGGDFFVRSAAQQWKRIVNSNVRKLESR